jgi:hypothetical protein
LIDNLPYATPAREDPQLEKALELLKEQIRKDLRPVPKLLVIRTNPTLKSIVDIRFLHTTYLRAGIVEPQRKTAPLP